MKREGARGAVKLRNTKNGANRRIYEITGGHGRVVISGTLANISSASFELYAMNILTYKISTNFDAA
jgi:hypothetical protein